MSLESWKAEFYSVPADEVTEADALAHSLTKWRGLLPEAMERHGVTPDEFGDLHSADGDFCIDADSCALCALYLGSSGCYKCPLFLSRRHERCDEKRWGGGVSPFISWRRHLDPLPMIAALEKAKAFTEDKK